MFVYPRMPPNAPTWFQGVIVVGYLLLMGFGVLAISQLTAKKWLPAGLCILGFVLTSLVMILWSRRY